ncbi:MAG: YdcF family protein [Bacteroidales bacterium]|nr:YdcF family protein [Bacteroidales bacterium]MCF8392051.1 YdcF family protein [Bacteroidales bacterium]
MNSKLKLTVVLLLFVLFVGSCRKAGTWLVKKDKPMHSDAIVILMGSIADRVLEASDLYKIGLANKLIIVEAGMGADIMLELRGVHLISNTAQTRDALVVLGVPSDSIIILPGGATSTQMESEIIKDYLLNESGIDTLLLVSSAYHTRRASIIFMSAFRNANESIEILSSPSTYTNFKAENWWRSKDGILVVMMEYLKMCNFFLFEKRKLKQEVKIR